MKLKKGSCNAKSRNYLLKIVLLHPISVYNLNENKAVQSRLNHPTDPRILFFKYTIHFLFGSDQFCCGRIQTKLFTSGASRFICGYHLSLETIKWIQCWPVQLSFLPVGTFVAESISWQSPRQDLHILSFPAGK